MSTTNITKKRATTSTSPVETPNKRLKQEEEAEGGPEKQQAPEKPPSVKKTKDQDQDQDQKLFLEDQVHKVQGFMQLVRVAMQELLQLGTDFNNGKCSSESFFYQINEFNVAWILTCDKILKDNALKTLNEWLRKCDNMEELHKTLKYMSALSDKYEQNNNF